eukprot:g32955.t1
MRDEAYVCLARLMESFLKQSDQGQKGLIPVRSDDIADHYELDERRIGSGSFGHVFSARQKQTGLQVAIKKVLIFDPEQKERLDTEACIMKDRRRVPSRPVREDLDHPNICKLMATYEKGRFMFFVMEYCKGKDVLERLMSLDEQKFGEHQAAKIVHQTALALHYAQKRGIAHRDVKPENLVFVSDEESDSFVKVVDWGLSSYCGERKMRSAVGSYVYCAPEILAKKLSRNSKSYTASCDLWSLGILIYVLLCGHPPFRGDATQLLKMAKEEKLIPQDDIWKALSREAKHLIQGLLRVKPEKRLKFEEVLKHPWFQLQKLGRTQWTFRDSSECDGDGVLTIQEVRQGFAALGSGNLETVEIEELFAIIDMDGSGTIDYTEFVAAAVGERLFQEESALMAAFEAFNHEPDGVITLQEIEHVLRSCDAQKVWSDDAVHSMAVEAQHHFTSESTIDFDHFRESIVAHVASRRGRCDSHPREPAELLEMVPRRAAPGAARNARGYAAGRELGER